MIGDNPAIYKRRPTQKKARYEKSFLTYFNKLSEHFRLVLCSQDFNLFDYWLIDKRTPFIPPRLVELKVHLRKNINNSDFVGLDYLKLQKLKAYSKGSKAYVFHLTEDATYVQDVESEIHKVVPYERDTGDIVMIALVHHKSCFRTFHFGFKDLPSESEAQLPEVSALRNPDAIAPETEAL